MRSAVAKNSRQITPRMKAAREPSGDVLSDDHPAISTRARISNHHDQLPGIDGRSGPARRFRDLVSDFISDLGGIAECSAIKVNLIRRLAATVVQSEMLESKMALGQPVDVASLCVLASTSLRLSARLGLERRARDLTPTLEDIRRDIDASRQRAAQADDEDVYDVAEDAAE